MVVALTLSLAIYASAQHAEVTLFCYAAIVVVTAFQMARTNSFSAFRVCRRDIAPMLGASLLVTVGFVVQYYYPSCLGLCNAFSAPRLNAAGLVETLLLANILAPVAETIMIQGWIYDFTTFFFGRQRYAVVSSAVLFGTWHLALTPPIAIAALVLSILRMRTGSLGPTALVHFVINLGVTAFFAIQGGLR